MKLIILLFILCLPFASMAQQSDSQLAFTYYQNKEYDKAAELFLKLYERTRSSNFLDYHVICLINGKQYEKAEEILKKFLKADETNKDFMVNLGYIYEQQGKTKKSEEYYEKAVQKLLPSTNDIQNLAYKFRDIRQYEWANKTYIKGREILKQPHFFLSEIGDNYMMERNYEQMFTLFVQALNIKPTELDYILSKLSFARSSDINNNVDAVIEPQLQEVFKKTNYNPVFDELAVWYNLQKKNYTVALNHATLLNQKSENKLHIFINIARAASGSHQYDIAETAYRKVLEKGAKDNNFYDIAQKDILICKYEKCEQNKFNADSYKFVADECQAYMQKSGYSYNSADIALLLSDIYAYRLSQPDSANIILQRSESIRQLNPSILSTIKSKRANLLAFMGNLWEATILYTQIEKANPNNDIGYEAKLKKAWLAYYAGDLLWAKAQFDVLKGSTTKLISNDAIKMSHFINLNYEEDGDNSLLERLAQTEYLIFKKQESLALSALDSIATVSKPEIADYTVLLKAKILISNYKYDEAAKLLDKLKNDSEQTYIRAEAIFTLASLKIKMQDKPQALELYKQLVSDYSGSVYSVESGKLYREIEKNEKAEN